MTAETEPTKGPSARVSRKRDERRERIIEAAFRAIALQGPGDFSLNQLARELDYTPGALYWYFPSKEALVMEIQSRAFGQMTELLRESRARWIADPAITRCAEPARLLHALLCQARWYLRLDDKTPEYTRIVAFSLDPRILLDMQQAQELMKVLGALFIESAVAFEAAQQAKVLSPANAVQRSLQYWAALHGMVATTKLARLSPDLFQVEALGMDNAETLLLGWGAPKRALATAKERLADTPL